MKAINSINSKEKAVYRIIWHTRPPYVASVSHPTSSIGAYVKGRLISRVIVKSENVHLGGSCMPNYTVVVD
jgi:hypothetical protein